MRVPSLCHPAGFYASIVSKPFNVEHPVPYLTYHSSQFLRAFKITNHGTKSLESFYSQRELPFLFPTLLFHQDFHTRTTFKMDTLFYHGALATHQVSQSHDRSSHPHTSHPRTEAGFPMRT